MGPEIEADWCNLHSWAAGVLDSELWVMTRSTWSWIQVAEINSLCRDEGEKLSHLGGKLWVDLLLLRNTKSYLSWLGHLSELLPQCLLREVFQTPGEASLSSFCSVASSAPQCSWLWFPCLCLLNKALLVALVLTSSSKLKDTDQCSDSSTLCLFWNNLCFKSTLWVLSISDYL